jgi:CheY-like chemotaxis protein
MAGAARHSGGDMSNKYATARILVASDNADDAAQIIGELEDDFENVRASTRADLAVQDFEQCSPDVLVLAFDSLEKAQRYYLGLYRLGKSLPQNSHRTVILCDREELRAVVELCKKEYFDDYVLYWPHCYDGSRLAMSIRIACREMAAICAQPPRPVDLLANAKHIDELDRVIGAELADTGQANDALRSIASIERDVAGAIDAFSSRLTDDGAGAWVDVKAKQVLAREIGRLKHQQADLARRAGEIGVAVAHSGARRLTDRIEPSLAGVRALAEEVRKVRPVVMVVEDDEFARQLVSRTLDLQAWEAVYVADGNEAMNLLRRTRPDVILMDIRLPGVDGVALTQRLKSTPRLARIPVIIMTSDARRETLESSVAAGAAAFVVKPFSRELLTTKLERALAM